MPLYEYQCDRCGRFEIIVKFSDAPLTVCPTCGQEVQKLLSAPAIQFKGTGWYITDYARKSSGGEGSKDGGTKDGGTKDGGMKSSPTGTDAGASKDGGKSGSDGSASSGASSETSSTSTKAAKTGSGSARSSS